MGEKKLRSPLSFLCFCEGIIILLITIRIGLFKADRPRRSFESKLGEQAYSSVACAIMAILDNHVLHVRAILLGVLLLLGQIDSQPHVRGTNLPERIGNVGAIQIGLLVGL